eukprot:CAMPEP_0175130410 /NCGR_PEP_ID=MMETSP0087-20121206/5992_1 /TAXON_ID=136419 /ORGANISM="Unknown Unknown, Strain D1" /LENGTH=1276 /DNA_ID=CAMNT_0016412627 /DNA_START=39 /DNA_END=3866 /DNA_ORIENTATION=+
MLRFRVSFLSLLVMLLCTYQTTGACVPTPEEDQRIVFYPNDHLEHTLTMVKGAGNNTVTTVVAKSSATIIGPALDRANRAVFYIRRDTAVDMFLLEKYEWATGKTTVIYQNPTASFPANDGGRLGTFRLIYNEFNKKVYWFVQSTARITDGDLFELDPWTAAPAPKKVLSFTDMYHWWLTVQADCQGDIYISSYIWIRKFTPGSTTFSEPIPRSLLQGKEWCKNTIDSLQCLMNTFAIDDWGDNATNRIYFSFMGQTTTFRTSIWSVKKDGSGLTKVYDKVLYEKEDYEMYIGSIALDPYKREMYLGAFLGNTAGRTLIKIKMTPPANRQACLYGLTPSCDYMQNGEELVVGNCEVMQSEFRFDNCAPGQYTRFPAQGDHQIVVIPSRQANPATQTCDRGAVRTNKATGSTAQCSEVHTEPDRQVFYSNTPGVMNDRKWYAEQLSGTGLWKSCARNGIYGTNCYLQDGSENTMNISEVGESSKDVVGPEIDAKRKYMFYFACMSFGGVRTPCFDWALKRYSWDTKTTITLYRASVTDLPGPSYFAQDKFSMGYDPINQIVYWVNTNVDKTKFFLYSLDLSSGATTFKPCDVKLHFEVSGVSSWTSLKTDCFGSLYIVTMTRILRIDPFNATSEAAGKVIATVAASCGNPPVANLYSCSIRGATIDDTTAKIYWNYHRGGSQNSFEIWESNMVDGSGAAMLYSGVFYETWNYMQYLGDMSVDKKHKMLYVLSYYQNSMQRSILKIPIKSAVNGGSVCLWGHPSIPAATYGKDKCDYLGGERYKTTDFEVVLPVLDAAQRISIGNQRVHVVPGDKGRQVSTDPVDQFEHPVQGTTNEAQKYAKVFDTIDIVGVLASAGWYAVTPAGYTFKEAVSECARYCVTATKVGTAEMVCESFALSATSISKFFTPENCPLSCDPECMEYANKNSTWGCPSTCTCSTLSYKPSFQCVLYSGRLETNTIGTNACSNTMYQNGAFCQDYLTFSRIWPIDCAMSNWTAWSECTGNKCGKGSRYRNRTVLIPPKNNGVICGPLSEIEACDTPPIKADTAPTEIKGSGYYFKTSTNLKTVYCSSYIKTVGAVRNSTTCYPHFEQACKENSACVAFDMKITNNPEAHLLKEFTETYCNRSNTSSYCESYNTFVPAPSRPCQLSSFGSFSACSNYSSCNEGEGAWYRMRERTLVQRGSGEGNDCQPLQEWINCTAPTSSPTHHPTQSPLPVPSAPSVPSVSPVPSAGPPTSATTTASPTGLPGSPPTASPTGSSDPGEVSYSHAIFPAAGKW